MRLLIHACLVLVGLETARGATTTSKFQVQVRTNVVAVLRGTNKANGEGHIVSQTIQNESTPTRMFAMDT